MPLFSTTAPDFNDSDHTLLAKIAQSLVDGQVQTSIITTKSVPVSDPSVPSKVLDANPKRRLAILQNMSGNNVAYVSGLPDANANGAGVGYPVYAQSPLNLPQPSSRMEVRTTGELWAASQGANFKVIEFLVP